MIPASANQLTLCPQTGALESGKRIWASLTWAKLWWLSPSIFSPAAPVGGSQTWVVGVRQECYLWEDLLQWWSSTGLPWCSSWPRICLIRTEWKSSWISSSRVMAQSSSFCLGGLVFSGGRIDQWCSQDCGSTHDVPRGSCIWYRPVTGATRPGRPLWHVGEQDHLCE